MLAGVHVQEEIRQRAFQPRSSSAIEGKARPGDLNGSLQVENPGLFPNFPMGLRLEIKVWGSTPPPYLDVFIRAFAYRHGRVQQVGHGEHEIPLLRVQLRNPFVYFLYVGREPLQIRGDASDFLACLHAPRNFVAGFVTLRLAVLVGGDELAALFVNGAEGVEVESEVAAPGHLRKEVEIFPKVAKVMHVWAALAPYLGRNAEGKNNAFRARDKNAKARGTPWGFFVSVANKGL